MSSSPCHVVLTRFNLRTSVTGATDVTSREWLQRRFELFETFCLPAMQAQAVPHKWLVWFDAETPADLRARVDAYRGVTPIWTEGPLDTAAFIRTIVSRIPESATHLITTRLDNDDGIADDFLARVQRASYGIEDVFLNFPLGYQWQAGRLYYSIQRANPFLSYVERVHRSEADFGIRTVATGNHASAGTDGTLRQLWSPPIWLQVLHGGNVANEMKGLRRTRARPPARFTSAPVASEPILARTVDVGRSAAFLLALPWRKRAIVARRLRARTTEFRRR